MQLSCISQYVLKRAIYWIAPLKVINRILEVAFNVFNYDIDRYYEASNGKEF
jgi:hypothetical protein